jgi:hypothetical protein
MGSIEPLASVSCDQTCFGITVIGMNRLSLLIMRDTAVFVSLSSHERSSLSRVRLDDVDFRMGL